MAKVIRIVCLSLIWLIFFGINMGETASRQKTNEIKSFACYQVNINGKKLRRIEFAMTQNAVYKVYQAKGEANRIIVEWENTVPSKIKPISRENAGDLKSVTLLERTPKVTRANLRFGKRISEKAYKVWVAPEERHGKSPIKLVIDVDESMLESENESSGSIEGKTIVLDPGHGGSDTGAIGPSGLLEKDVAFDVALKLEEMLKNSGANVVMTRYDDVDVYGANASATQELQARADVANRRGDTDVFLSIHCNGHAHRAANGMETFYYFGSVEGELLATYLNEELESAGGLRNRGVKAANIYVLKHTNMPASLVELAFITNYDEEALLGDDEYRQKMAQALYTGLSRYFAGK